MKLKGLGNRLFNVLFHTHTVAGIVISFALFVIFYAGAFSLFRHEIMQWENPEMRQPYNENVDIDKALLKVDSVYNLNLHEITNVNFPSETNPMVSVFGAYNDTDSTTKRVFASVNPLNVKVNDLNEPRTTVANTLYHLHYFRQVPVVGLYIAGFVALFFLFASVTGILIHWRNILTKFYAFITEGKWKVIWTNLHTVLGVIGLPFQIMYAVTGAFYGLLILILLPSVFLLYGGDREKLFAKIQPQQGIQIDENAPEANHLTLNELAKGVRMAYPNHKIKRVQLRNYGKSDAFAAWQIDDDKNINSTGLLSMYMKDGKILDEFSIIPDAKRYSNSVTDYIFKLHFANYGGLIIKITYFVLALLTCFMILSGVLIWRKARQTNQYRLEQQLFHHKVTKWYLAICLSMFPAFALLFIANKIVPMELESRASYVNTIFFVGWFLLIVLSFFWKSYAKQNQGYLAIGGLLSIIVPIANGVITGGWVWNMLGLYNWVAYIDIFWFATGMVALCLSFFVLNVKQVPKEFQETVSAQGRQEEVVV